MSRLLAPFVFTFALAAEAFVPGSNAAVTITSAGRCASGLAVPGMARGTCPDVAGLPRRKMATVLRGGEVFAQQVAEAETYEFEAEVTKVMDIIINSLYSDKDIFLRELVSNASDACDKKRFLSLTDDNAGGYEGRIRIIGDKEKNTLTIEDNGIGMTRKELQENLGRIAQSGTKKFTEALGSGSDATNLIGQFGVGFYSAFLVADKVTVVTKAGDGEQLRWESEAASKYTISTDESEPIESSGTRLILHLKEDADKYIEDFTIRDMLKRYSEFISFPIELWAEKTEYDTVPDPDAEVKEGEEPPTKTVPRTSNVWEKINVAKPLWMRPPKEVTDEEYAEFYKTAFKQYDTPAAHVHFSLEGQVEFRAMLFVPSSVPWELSQDMFNEKVKPMKLFVKRVFISDNFDEQLLPRWLNFLKGVVDSEDLPLNVSRELLQKSKVLSIIRKRLVRKALDMFGEIAKDEDKFKTFSTNFGRYIKVGLIEDKEHKDALLKLATFSSSAVDEATGTTIVDYVGRMKEGQKQIYYVSGASRAAAAASPVLEGLRAKGYEVLFALDQIDEIALQGVGKYEDYDVVDASKEDAAPAEEKSEEEKEADKAAEEAMKPVLELCKDVLGEAVDKVTLSSRLTSSPAALVQPQWGMSPQMQRFMKAQAAAAGGDDAMMGGMAANLELNKDHPVVVTLKEKVDAEPDAADTKEFARLLYDVAAVSSGYEIKDAAAFSRRVVQLMAGEALSFETVAEEDADNAAVEVPAGEGEPISPTEVIEE